MSNLSSISLVWKDGTWCDLVHCYEIEAESSTLTLGSLILDENKTQKASMESAILSFGICFDVVDRDKVIVDVRLENKHAISFYQRLGMTEMHRIDGQTFFTYPRARLDADKSAYLPIINLKKHDA